MKKILFIAVIAFAAVQSFAVGLGLRDALIIGGLTGDADDFAGTGDVFTFEMLFPINDVVAIHPAVGFEYASYDASYEEYDGWYTRSATSYLAYIDMSMPVMVRFNITPGLFAEGGVNIGLNLFTISWYEYGNYDSDAEIVDEANSLNVDLAFGAGYVFGFGLGIDGRFTYGLTNIIDEDGSDAGRFGVHIGISYWFKKR
ncbi:MAG: PorT family protein [Fibrobacter sp.]|nr:PorT family protein [Fibrobacter sp.]